MKHWVTVAIVVATLAAPAYAERVKDIADVKGIRSNPLQGYGLVVGLNGTGDDSAVSKRMLTNLLRRYGLVMSPLDVASKNMAFVTVTAELGPFSRAGTTIDVTISSAGNSTSLQGGTLLLTPLQGADGQVYAVAQGPMTLGGFSASGAKSSVSQNHATVGRIPNGASVEREELATFLDESGAITLSLRNPDFSTAEAVRTAVNGLYPASAETLDGGTIRVHVPADRARKELAALVDKIGNLDVKVDSPAVVVINERTGTVVVGQNVGISMVAISHGNLSIITQEKEDVSQPQPFSKTGTTEKTQRTEITAVEEMGTLRVMPHQVSVAELARALNAMGLSPRDLVSIFEALRQAGALQAQLKVM
ncbi:MAG: flagellar basal body P-ring protein FlgI [Planctomycetota bacterium]|nr:flagellar basal body P-ring protein FlgI [Planctomycetota bacterium]